MQEDITETVKALVANPAKLKAMIGNFDVSHLPDPLDAADAAADIAERLAHNKQLFK